MIDIGFCSQSQPRTTVELGEGLADQFDRSLAGNEVVLNAHGTVQ